MVIKKEKIKTYEFSTKGLNKCINDIKQDKINKVFDVAFYIILISLFSTGVIGEKFITTYFATTLTSKTVKFLMH
jgi:hypothetical protein